MPGKTEVTSRFLLLLVLCAALAVGATAGTEGKPLSWAPTKGQLEAWIAPGGPGTPRSTPPIVSLKVALEGNTPPTSLKLLGAAWTSVRSDTPVWKGKVAATLGAHGVFHGVSYQEILVHPVRASGRKGEVLLLTALKLELTFERGSSADDEIAPAHTGPLSPFSGLFLNPQDAVEQKNARIPGVVSHRTTVFTGSALRIELSHDGVYRLDYNYLVNHGFDPGSIDPAKLHLTRLGTEVPIYIEGPVTGTFGSSNAIVFYGQKMNVTTRPIFNGGDFTNTAVYWLTADGNAGLRMAEVPSAPTSGFAQPSSFSCTVHFEHNDFFYCVYHLRPDGDLWYWGPPLYQGNAGSYSLDLPHPAVGTGVAIKAVMGDFSSGDHSFSVRLNGGAPTSGPDPATWSGLTLATFTWDFANPLAGSNTLELTVSTAGDYLIPDYFNVTYSKTFNADSDVLDFDAPNVDARYACNGFSSLPYVLDISRNPASSLVLPALLTGVSFSSGTATFEMAYDAAVTSRKVVLSASPLLPDKAEITTVRNLGASSLGADLLIITHPDFHPQGHDAVWQRYLARREAEMSVQVVDIQEIYDNYSYGVFDPTAIKTFLESVAANWSPVPKYVLLIGDASYDYKNYMNDPTFKDWVPTMMFENLADSTYMGYYCSDAWFADVNGDGFPDMDVGRLPVRSYDELAGVLTKIMAYEDQLLAGSWYKTGLFVAGTYTQPWEQEFETYNNYLQSTYYTTPWVSSHVYFHDPPYNGTDADACAAAIRSAWPDSGLIHYAGHSGIEFWGDHYDFFTAFPSRNCGSGTCSDVDLLPSITTGSSPYAPLPFVLNSSCYNSAFEEPRDPALMEALVDRTDGGSIGSTGFSTIAWLDEEETFNDAIFGQAFGRYKVRTLGDLAEAGRFASPSTLPRITLGNILLGDPTLKLRLPAPPPPNSLSAASMDSAVLLSWLTPATAPASFNVYRSSDGRQTWVLAASVSGTSSSYQDNSLSNGSTYYYYLTSVDSEGFEGPSGNIALAIPAPTPCSLTCSAQVPTDATAGIPVNCRANATSANCSGVPSFDWDFGDGSAHSSAQNPTHTYATAGTYTWAMTATVNGASCTKSGTIQVSSASCTLTCTATVPSTGQAGTAINFQSSANSTPSGCTTLTFDWNFGDNSTHSSAQNPSHTYATAGIYTWILTVSGSGASSCTKTGTINISASCTLACSAQIPTETTAGIPVNCRANATSANCSGTPSFDWDFGDNTAHSSDQNVDHDFVKPGTFNWTMTATQDGQVCLESGTTTVANPPAVSLMKKLGGPFRVDIKGANYQSGIRVYIKGLPWTDFAYKSNSKLVLKKGAALKALFPEGADVPIHLINPDKGEVTILYNRSSNSWHYSAEALIHPPAVFKVRKRKATGSSLQIIIKGADFNAGTTVYVQGNPWTDVSVKSDTKIVLNNDSALKVAFPVDTYVWVRIVNADGGETTVRYNRSSNTWVN